MTAKNCLSCCFVRIALFGLMTVPFTVAQLDQQKPLAPAPTPSSSVTTTPIPASLFGMSSHSDVLFGTPWPTMPIYGMRLWDAGTGWGQINTASGVYDWTLLDSWIAAAGRHNDQLIFTFGMTPTWASSKPTDASCDYGAGFCDPPNDLKTDGTGTDQHFINFVTAIAKHAPSITYWEMWNTPHDIAQWTGTNAQLVRMVKDASTYIKKYIPGAKIIAPANGQLNYPYPSSNCTMPDKMGGYLAAGLGKYLDIMALHTYYTTVPEDIVPVLQCYQSTMATYKVSSLPLWSTEGAWGLNSDLPGSSDQAGFVARLYLLLWSNGVVRHYWYNWDDENTGTLSDNGVPNSVATAYQQVESWMTGRTMSTLCAENGSGIWTCGFTGSNGYASQAVWYPGGNTSYTAPSSYINYLDLGGTTHSITSGATITVGVEPILLQNQVGNSGTPDFALSEQSPFPEVTVGTAGTTGTITISSEDGFSGTVNLSCPTTFGASSCSISPTSVSTFPATSTLTVNGTSFSAGTYQLALQGTSGALTHSFNVAFNVGDFSLTGPASLAAAPSSQATANLSVQSLYSYSGQVNATCNATALTGAQCMLTSSNPIAVGSGATVPVTVTVAIPANALSGVYNISVEVADINGNSSHSLTIPLTVSTPTLGFNLGSFAPATQTITSGQSATYNFSVIPTNGSFPNAVNLTCSGGPAHSQCAFNTNPVTPGSTSAPVVMTITTTSASAASRRPIGKLAILWLVLPTLMAFVAASSKAGRNKLFLPAALLGTVMLMFLLPSCSGSAGIGSTGNAQPPVAQGTPPGTYTVTVTGSSGSLPQQAATVTLIVNQ